MTIHELAERPDLIEAAEEMGSSPDGSGHDQYFRYKSICTWSLVSIGLGLLSVLAFLDWALLAIPALGVLLGLLAWRQIARRPQELTGLRLARLGMMLSALFLVAGGGYQTYVYVTEVPPGYSRISYDTLKDDLAAVAEQTQALDVDQYTQASLLEFSRKASNIDGDKVFIKGYIYPTGKSKVNQFVLCRDNAECCFGGNPKPADMILVRMREGEKMQFSKWQKKVAGVLRFAPISQEQDGDVTMHIVYQLEEAFER